VPHRSLSKRGLWWVILSVSVLALLVSIRFWMLGAWPVLPFSAVEVGLVLLMLHLNTRQTRASELVLLTETELRIVRTGVSGQRREVVLPAGWLSVSLRERDGRVPRLLLSRHGRSEEIGLALGESEKRDLAACLTRALHRARNPVFDNPQLRA
jgi:uncharacterized membrane protein